MPFRSAAPRAVSLLLSLALAACAASPSPSPPTARAPAAPGPARPPAAAKQPAPQPAAPPAPAAGSSPSPALAPEKLKGLSEAQASALLGEPADRLERSPARVWVYEAAECRLELAFYLDVSGSGFRVLSHKTAPKGSAPLNGAACVERLRSARK